MTDFATAMPNMLRHLGEWEGIYTHIGRDGAVLDSHRTWTRCDFRPKVNAPMSSPIG